MSWPASWAATQPGVSSPYSGCVKVRLRCSGVRWLKHREIEGAQRGVGRKRGGPVRLRRRGRQVVLREGLRLIVMLAGGKADASGQHQLGLDEMRQDLPRGPLAGGVAALPAFLGPALDQRAYELRGFGHGGKRLRVPEFGGIRVLVHGRDGNQAAMWLSIGTVTDRR